MVANHTDFDNPAVRQHMDLYYSICAEVVCGTLDPDQAPAWNKLLHLCGDSERRAKDVLIETYLFRLSDVLAPGEPANAVEPSNTGQLQLFA